MVISFIDLPQIKANLGSSVYIQNKLSGLFYILDEILVFSLPFGAIIVFRPEDD